MATISKMLKKAIQQNKPAKKFTEKVLLPGQNPNGDCSSDSEIE